MDICPSLDEADIGYPFELDLCEFSLMACIKCTCTLLKLNFLSHQVFVPGLFFDDLS